jgi:DNA-binding transcriptional LysR family regulator
MDLKHLRTFVAVAESGTVSKAATRRLIGQPALSRQVMELERDLGVTLFDRVGRRLRLTGEGEQFLEHCRGALSGIDSLGERAQELRRTDHGTLRVAASPQMIDNVFSTFLHRYAARFPDVQVHLVESFGDATLVSVERGEVHLGVVVDEAVPSGPTHFQGHPLTANIHIAAYAARFALARGAIEIRNLVRYPYCPRAAEYPVRRELAAFSARARRSRPRNCGHSVECAPASV